MITFAKQVLRQGFYLIAGSKREETSYKMFR